MSTKISPTDTLSAIEIMPLEKDTAQTVDAINAELEGKIEALKVNRAKRYDEQMAVDLDADYYSCIVFESLKQKREFFCKLMQMVDNLLGEDTFPENYPLRDESHLRYINGMELATALGIELTPAQWVPYEPADKTAPKEDIDQ